MIAICRKLIQDSQSIVLLKAALTSNVGPRNFYNQVATTRTSNASSPAMTSTTNRKTNFFETVEEDRKAYVCVFDEFVETLTSLEMTKNPKFHLFFEHFKKTLYYNVPHGKMARTLPISISYKYFHKNPSEVTEEEIFLCSMMGWCFETIHSYVLFTDDIIDGSTIRRKKPCWHLNDQIGLSAINDAFSMHSGAVKVLHRYFHDKPYYTKALELINQYCWDVHVGQTLDVLLQINHPSKYSQLKELHTRDNYLACAEYKTSATFWSTLSMALYMNGITDPEVHNEAKELMKRVGYLFQFKNDGEDAFGGTSKTIVVGTDIEEGKCTLFSVWTLEIGSARQIKILQDNIGRKDSAGAKLVKNVYYELGFPEMQVQHTRNVYNEIIETIQNSKYKLLEEIFRYCVRVYFGNDFKELE